MVETAEYKDLLKRIEYLENRLEESEQLIDAIKAGEVDAFAVNENDRSEIYTLQSGDYAYRLLIEEFGEGAVNLSEDGLIVYTNNYFADLLHSSYEKVIGRKFFDFIDPCDKEKFSRLFFQALSGKSKGEINLLTSQGIVCVYISLTSLQPKLSTVGIIVTDLTEKKKNEETLIKYRQELEEKNAELAQSNVELNSFSYIASHDLQEPLRKIQTFCDRILQNETENLGIESRDHFGRIISAAKRMQHLINSLLNYSRISASESLFTKVRLSDVIDDVLRDLSELIEHKQIEIKAENLPVIRAIPDQIVQLFTNLIGNSIKYRRKGIVLEIRISAFLNANENQWEITVSDNGIGFDPQYSKQIFELFQRLHSRFEYEGTGIGLSIVKKIVQNHKGYVEAIGENGVGSTFIIHLPV